MCLMMMESFIIVFTGMLSLLVSFGLTGIYPCIAGAQGRLRQQGGWAHDSHTPYRHVYHPLISMGYSKLTAKITVFLLSAFFHEVCGCVFDIQCITL